MVRVVCQKAELKANICFCYWCTDTDISHDSLEEIVIFRSRVFGEDNMESNADSCISLLDYLFRGDQQGAPKPFSALQKVRFVCCRGCLSNEYERIKFAEVHVWNANTASFDLCNEPSVRKRTSLPRIEFVFEEYDEESLSESRALYILQSEGLMPYVAGPIGKNTRGTVIDEFMMPTSRSIPQFKRVMSITNLDLYSSLTYATWSSICTKIRSKDEKEKLETRAMELAKLAAKHGNGRILRAEDLKKLLVEISNSSKNKETYVDHIIHILQLMYDNGWDLYCDDYAKAALPYGKLFDAILEMDKKKQRESSVEDTTIGDTERKTRLVSLLKEACANKWYTSVTKILEFAGSDYVNQPLEDGYKTVLHYAIENASEVPQGYLQYLLQLKPKDIRTITNMSYLHCAAESDKCSDQDILLLIMNLASTIDINAQYSDGSTVLHYLCERGRVALALFAVEKAGANPAIKSYYYQKYPADLLLDYMESQGEYSSVYNCVEIPKSLYYSGFVDPVAQARLKREEEAKRQQAITRDDNVKSNDNELEEDEIMVEEDADGDVAQEEQHPGKLPEKVQKKQARASSSKTKTTKKSKRGKRKREEDAEKSQEQDGAAGPSSLSAAAATPVAEAKKKKK